MDPALVICERLDVRQQPYNNHNDYDDVCLEVRLEIIRTVLYCKYIVY